MIELTELDKVKVEKIRELEAEILKLQRKLTRYEIAFINHNKLIADLVVRGEVDRKGE